MTETSEKKTFETVTKPLYATLGAGEALVSTITDTVRTKLTREELRKSADNYVQSVSDFYTDLAARGEERFDKLRTDYALDDRLDRVEGLYDDAINLAEEALNKVTEQAKSLADKVSGGEKPEDKPEPKVAEVIDLEAEVIPEPASETDHKTH